MSDSIYRRWVTHWSGLRRALFVAVPEPVGSEGLRVATQIATQRISDLARGIYR